MESNVGLALQPSAVRRLQDRIALEEAIKRLNPDALEAQDLLDALTASLEARYESAAVDVSRLAGDLRVALDELDGTPEAA